MEAGRAVQRGLVTPDRTTLIASTNRVYSMTEKTAITDGRVDSAKVIEASGAAAKVFVHGDFARIAEDARSVISASLFGALAAYRRVAVSPRTIRGSDSQGRSGSREQLGRVCCRLSRSGGIDGRLRSKSGSTTKAKLGRVFRRSQRASKANSPGAEPPKFYIAGIERLADYQDVAYASEYLDRLEPIRDVDRRYGHGDFTLLSETADTSRSGCRMKTRRAWRI